MPAVMKLCSRFCSGTHLVHDAVAASASNISLCLFNRMLSCSCNVHSPLCLRSFRSPVTTMIHKWRTLSNQSSSGSRWKPSRRSPTMLRSCAGLERATVSSVLVITGSSLGVFCLRSTVRVLVVTGTPTNFDGQTVMLLAWVGFPYLSGLSILILLRVA